LNIVSTEGTDLEPVIAVCFLVIFSVIAIMMGPIGFLFIIFAVLVIVNGLQKNKAKKSQSAYPTSTAGPAVVTIDRRVVYQLPRICPECGGSLSNEEADWVGPLQAKCSYCHATVEAVPAEF
jgi:hypothetical protein